MSKARKRPQRAAFRRFSTSKPVKARLVAQMLAAQSRRWLARDGDLEELTLRRVPSQEELNGMLAKYLSALLEMAPEAISVYRKALEKNNFQVAVKILELIQALVKGGAQGLELPKSRFAGWTEEEMRIFVETGRWPQGKPRPY